MDQTVRYDPRIAWFYEKYPYGYNGSAEFENDVRRAQEILLDAHAQRKADAIVIQRRLGWRAPKNYPTFLSGKFYRGPNAA